mgnify:CR=1 FL=1
MSVRTKKYAGLNVFNKGTTFETIGMATDHVVYGYDNKELIGTVTGSDDSADQIDVTINAGITLVAGQTIMIGDRTGVDTTIDYSAGALVAGSGFDVANAGAGIGSTGIQIENSKGAGYLNIANDTSGLSVPLYRRTGRLVYTDMGSAAAPITVETEQVVIHPVAAAISAKSNQFISVRLKSKNGVAYDAAATDADVGGIMINLDRIILMYEGALSTTSATADDWVIWYDTSKTNNAGLDSPFVQILECETSLDGTEEFFVNHIGGLGAFLDMKKLSVNGQMVDFPDISVSGVVRTKNVVSAVQAQNTGTTAFKAGTGATANDTIMKIKGSGKHGFSVLVVDDTLAEVVGKTDATNLLE